MKVICGACSAKYNIADDKVRGRRVKIRCKSCGQPITVDGTAMDDPVAELDDAAEEDSTRIMSGPPAFEAPDSAPRDVWNVSFSDEDQRTMSLSEIVAGWQAGTITDDVFVWRDGMGDWQAILQVPEIASALGSGGQATAVVTPQASFSPPRAPAAARVARPRGSGADLFGAAAEVESAPAAAPAQAGSQAYDAAPTGSRNENSVLFSLDALKKTTAAAPAPAPRAGAGPRPPKPGPGARPEPTSFDDLMNLSAGPTPMFGVPGGADLLNAPPPPEPPPPPPVAVAVATPGGASLVPAAPAPASGGKGKWIAVALGVVVVVGGALALGMSLGGKKDAPPTAGVTPEPKRDEPAAEPKKPEDKPAAAAEPKPEEAKVDEKKPDEAKPDEKKPDEKKPDEKLAATGEKKPDEKKPDEKKPDEKKPDEASAGAAPPFNKGAAVAALSAAAGQAAGCKKEGGPTGSGKATVTFAPSGRATSANVSGGAFGGTSVGGCVASIFRRAKVPPYTGDQVTVSKSFTVPD